METKAPLMEYLVVDAAGFLKNVDLRKIGKHIYTVAEVVSEIRDAETRRRLQVLPYELHYVEPDKESLTHVTEFSKRTGDYASLSATDLKVIAATYLLQAQNYGTAMLKAEPKIVTTSQFPSFDSDSKNLPPGFYLPPKQSGAEPKGDHKEQEHDVSERLNDVHLEDSRHAEIGDASNGRQAAFSDSPAEEDGDSESRGCESDDGEDNDNDDDAGISDLEDTTGWITPENFQRQTGVVAEDCHKADDDVHVACLTTDFSIQNVLIHMGLKIVSVDGMLIRRLSTWILRCYSCFATTNKVTKKFCPNCGNDTLKRLSLTVNPDGSIVYHLSRRKIISTKGTNCSLPRPRGGKHSNNPILCEDQPMPQNRLSRKAMQKMNILDADYVIGDSPFKMHDVSSRAAAIGVRHLNGMQRRLNTGASGHRKRGGKRR